MNKLVLGQFCIDLKFSYMDILKWVLQEVFVYLFNKDTVTAEQLSALVWHPGR